MNSFTQMCSTIEKKLGRKLESDEVKFLQWVYKRQLEEEYKKHA